MNWETLFERTRGTETTVDAVRETLTEQREQ
jgi:hypothetical protein